jgi:hypothetical protein
MCMGTHGTRIMKPIIVFCICMLIALYGCGTGQPADESLSAGLKEEISGERAMPMDGSVPVTVEEEAEAWNRHDAEGPDAAEGAGAGEPAGAEGMGTGGPVAAEGVGAGTGEKVGMADTGAEEPVSATGADAERPTSVADENPGMRQDSDNSAAIQRLDAGAIKYLGAFRLPGSEEWEWSGEALCFHADGNHGKGSLFGTGHNHRLLVSEISIPEPVISDNVANLPSADTIQPFADIYGGLYNDWYTEIPRLGLEILDDRIYFCRGEHFQNDGNPMSHGHASINLANPDTKGLWRVGDMDENYATNDYIFKIPEEWSRLYAPGYTLATGRYRDGGWGGMGPSLLMIRPNEMKSGKTSISAAELIRYTDVDNWSGDRRYRVDKYCEADTWTGGAWIYTDAGSAVIFCGNHGFGPDTWYGFADGTVYPVDGNGPFPEVPPYPYNERGWWNNDLRPALMLYDPNDLAKSAAGKMKPYEVQPYAILDISKHTYVPLKDTIMRYLGALAYDNTRQRLYVQELFADGAKPVIHVFGIEKP